MIGFESDEVRLKRIRERLQAMSDEELIRYGLALRRMKSHRVSGVPDKINELEEARAEWRRRHPSKKTIS